MAMGANGASEPPFFADLTGRHPEDDNAELLWHCGVFPPGLANEKGVTIGCHQGKGFKGAGQFELKQGDITLLRFDSLRGDYKLLFGEGSTTQGPYSKGTYVWAKFHDWPEWERKFVCGPYIHHCTGVYGSFAHIFRESVKYLKGVEADPVYPTDTHAGRQKGASLDHYQSDGVAAFPDRLRGQNYRNSGAGQGRKAGGCGPGL